MSTARAPPHSHQSRARALGAHPSLLRRAEVGPFFSQSDKSGWRSCSPSDTRPPRAHTLCLCQCRFIREQTAATATKHGTEPRSGRSLDRAIRGCRAPFSTLPEEKPSAFLHAESHRGRPAERLDGEGEPEAASPQGGPLNSPAQASDRRPVWCLGSTGDSVCLFSMP